MTVVKAVLVSVLLVLCALVGFASSASAVAGPMPSGPIYGDTLDNAAFGNYTKVVTGSQHAQSVGRTLTHRIVIDPNTSHTDYAPAINALSPYSYLMAELFDSSAVKNTSLAAYGARADEYVSAFGNKINVYEVGNEINGEWLGTTSDVAAKQYSAYQKVHNAGLTTALTGYYNPNCYSSSDHQMLPWLSANIPADEKAGLNYVFVSYYEVDCNNHRITQSELDSVFSQLHAMFPNAKLGFGEIGLDRAIGTNSANLAKAQDILTYYYGLQPTGMDSNTFVRGGFWWYGQEDLYPYDTKALWSTYQSAILHY